MDVKAQLPVSPDEPGGEPPPEALPDDELDDELPPSDTHTLSVLHGSPLLHVPAHALSTTSWLYMFGSASGGIWPAQEIIDVQNGVSLQTSPPAQSAFVVQTIGSQCGPPWHVAGFDPAGQLAGGGPTTSASAPLAAAICAKTTTPSMTNARFIVASSGQDIRSHPRSRA